MDTTPPPADAAALPRLDANQLRRLAEKADGNRGRDLVLFVDAQGEVDVGPADDPQLPATHLVRVRTERKAAGRKLPKRVVLTLPNSGREVRIDPTVYDLVAWGEAAADKFLVPYYVRFYGETEMDTLRQAIASDEVVAITHYYPTMWEDVTDEARRTLLASEGARDPLWVLADPPRADAGTGPAAAAEDAAGGFVPLRAWLARRRA